MLGTKAFQALHERGDIYSSGRTEDDLDRVEALCPLKEVAVD
jgi:hypothetical protein